MHLMTLASCPKLNIASHNRSPGSSSGRRSQQCGLGKRTHVQNEVTHRYLAWLMDDILLLFEDFLNV
jgi:hypothetical protein